MPTGQRVIRNSCCVRLRQSIWLCAAPCSVVGIIWRPARHARASGSTKSVATAAHARSGAAAVRAREAAAAVGFNKKVKLKELEVAAQATIAQSPQLAFELMRHHLRRRRGAEVLAWSWGPMGARGRGEASMARGRGEGKRENPAGHAEPEAMQGRRSDAQSRAECQSSARTRRVRARARAARLRGTHGCSLSSGLRQKACAPRPLFG